MINLQMSQLRLRRWCWYSFDAGNSAHALMVSTVGFALYFKIVLLENSPNGDSLWGILTAIILSVAGLLSPFITSWLNSYRLRWLGLMITTLLCVISTALLALPLSSPLVIGSYFVSAVTYYLALPIYTSYLGEWSDKKPDTMSAAGWSIGYIGGISAAALAFAFGLFDQPISERPDLYRLLFLLAAVFNLILSVPMLVLAAYTDRRLIHTVPAASPWGIQSVFDVFRICPKLFRLLFSYWMVGECGTITLYFTAIFLAQYAKMPVAKIFALTLIVQLIAAPSTWLAGKLSERFGRSLVFRVVCMLWILVPILLWSISYSMPFWLALFFIGLVLGAHHSIIRSEISLIASDKKLPAAAQGSIYGFLEVTGRVSSVLGPLLVAISTVFFPLSESLLIASVFPVIAIVVIGKYQWETKQKLDFL